MKFGTDVETVVYRQFEPETVRI